MDDFLISSIIGWGPSWSPRGWSICEGQLLSIADNPAVFSLIKTIYGGDGRTTFALPDLRGRAPIGYGQSPGTNSHPQGSSQGSETQVLTVLEMPSHTHTVTTKDLSSAITASTTDADTNVPGPDKVLAKGIVPESGPAEQRIANVYVDAAKADTTVQGGAVTGSVINSSTGGGQPFSILQPVTAINFIFCMQGIYPSRN